MNEETEYEDDSEISKSQLKREMHALQAMGRELVEMPEGRLRKIPMPEVLSAAIAEARRIRQREGKRRQLQYVGKVMRKIDVEPIRQAMEMLDHQSQAYRQHFHQMEQWRDQVVAQEPGIIEQLLEHFPQADRQQLRNLQRQAAKETQEKNAPVASRKIFAYIRELAET